MDAANQNNDFFLFSDFLEILRERGFSVDIEDYVHAVQICHHIDQNPVSLNQLKHSLAAIICRNENEQKQFYLLFDSYIEQRFKKHYLDEINNFEQKKEREKAAQLKLEKEKKKRIRNILLCLAGIITVGLAFFFYFGEIYKTDYIGREFRFQERPHLTTDELFEESILEQGAYQQKWNSRESLYQNHFDPRMDTTNVKANWDLHDTIITDKLKAAYRFKAPGIKKIAVAIISPKDTSNYSQSVLVCDERPIISSNPIGSVNERTVFTVSNNKTSQPLIWVIDNKDTIISRNDELQYIFREKGDHTIDCQFQNQFCTHNEQNSFQVSVIDKNEFTITTAPEKEIPVQQIKELNKWFYILLGILGVSVILFLLIYYYFGTILRKYFQDYINSNTKNDYLSQTGVPVFDGMHGPIDIVFLDKNPLIKTGNFIRKWAFDLKRKISSEELKLHFSKTIRNTIKNEDLFSPVFENKNIRRLYLFLIDETFTKSPQIKLYKFLIEQLGNQQVEFETYYYSKSPLNVYQKKIDDSVTLNHLKNKYYGSVLVLFGDADNFMLPNIPELNSSITKEYSYWINRILITSKPSKDWKLNEKIAAAFFHLAPADSVGLLGIYNLLQNTRYIQKPIQSTQYNTYSTQFIDFEEIDEIEKYLGNKLLFEWLTAIAVYPKITWEVIIAIGSVICPDAVTYDNLLKICRIDWLSMGSFPTTIRLELLKRLSPENEKKARLEIIRLLEEDTVIEEKSFACNERKMQLIINKFIVFTLAPDDFPHYQKEEKEFFLLYENNTIKDLSFKVYLQGDDLDKPNDSWQNPLGVTQKINPLSTLYNNKTASKSEEEIIRKWKKRVRNVLAVLTTILLTLGFMGYQKYDNTLFITTTTILPDKLDMTFVVDKCFAKFNPSGVAVMDNGRIIYQRKFPNLESTTIDATFVGEIENFKNLKGKDLTVQFTSAKYGLISKNVVFNVSGNNFYIRNENCNPEAANQDKTIVYLQFYPEKLRDSMEMFKAELKSLEYNVASGLDNKEAAKSEIRYYYEKDKGMADDIAIKAAGFFNQPIVPQRVITDKPKNQIEAWIKKEDNNKPCSSLQSGSNKYIIYYDYDKSNINPESALLLDKIIQRVKGSSDTKISITSYYNSGTSSYSLTQSERMSKSTSQYFISKGLNPNNITGKGKGKSEFKNQKCYNRTEIVLTEATVPPVSNGYAYYGIYSDDKWTERNFNNITKGNQDFPEAGDIIQAIKKINIREKEIQLTDAKGFENARILGILNIGAKVRVTNVIRVAGGSYIWIKFDSGTSPAIPNTRQIQSKK